MKPTMTMTLKATLAQLEALGNEKMRAQNKRHGAHGEQFGVRRGEVRKLAKEIKGDHELALALWETGNIDARFLAILMMKPKALSADEVDRSRSPAPPNRANGRANAPRSRSAPAWRNAMHATQRRSRS